MLKAIIKFFKEFFSSKPKPSQPVENPPVNVPVVIAPGADTRALSREQYANLSLAIFEGRVKVNPYNDEKPYVHLRETNGNNRDKYIDRLILRQGGSFGQAYCQYGQQDKMDALAAYLKIPRKLWNYPEGGGTQRVWAATDSRYKRSFSAGPLPACFVTVEYNNSGKGHIEDIFEIIGAIAGGWKVRTKAFNTTIDGDDSIVRDGAGAGLATRKITESWKQGSDTVRLKGFTDHYLIYVDAYKKHHNIT